MSKNKSQLDIYQIDCNFAFEEILDRASQDEKERLLRLLEEYAGSEPTPETVQEYSRLIIGHIIGAQNKKANVIRYSEIKLEPSEIRGYRLFLYEACSTPESPIVAILDGRTVTAPKLGKNVSHILFACDSKAIYACCSGAGWQVITPYANSMFGLQILSRLIPQTEEAISSARYRGFAGTVAAQETNFRQKARANEIAEFGRLFKDLSGRVSADMARDELGVNLSAGKKSVGAVFKNSFRMRKSMTLQELGDLLLKLTELLDTTPLFSIEDWMGIARLGRTKRDQELREKLFLEAASRIYRWTVGIEPSALDIFICDPRIAAYTSAHTYRLSVDGVKYSYDEFNDENDLRYFITALVDGLSDEENHENEVASRMSRAQLCSYIEGENSANTQSELWKCLQLSIIYEERNYMLIEGEWYTVYEGLETRLNRELPQMIHDKKSAIRFPVWSNGLPEDRYLDELSRDYGHAKLHQKRPIDQSELCDTILLHDKKLYFCHVKDGFDTKMRVLAAQVRMSAKILSDLRNGNRLDEMERVWQGDYAQINNLPAWSDVKKAILRQDGYDVVECIIFDPLHNLSESVEWSRSVIAKYELSALIKGWSYEFPLEITMPS
jgi:uncharacterized protein (TIGR04141 family)